MDKAAANPAEVPRLRRYARALVRDADEADDLVQECVARALASQQQWRRRKNPRAWLFTILHNIYVDDIRRRARRPHEVPIDSALETTGAGDSGGDLTAFEIDHALSELSPDRRQALMLVTLEGLSYAEVAAVLDIPIGTVMSRIARAREQLRRSLFDESGAVRRLKRVK